MMDHEQRICRVLGGREALALPLVFDSPHSGTECPGDMETVAPAMALNTAWDAYVDELWSGVADLGGALLAARFHRTYIDPNRARTDIDPELLEEPWPVPLQPTVYSARGMGLIRRYALPGVPMYARKLSLLEIEHRVTQYYDPYHNLLADLLHTAHGRFGRVWHVNCHSMKSTGNAMNIDNGSARPDMVISDRRGTTADPEFTRWVAEELYKFGYRVYINSPYSGGDIVRKYGAPSRGRHSIQIEINRHLYMNEETFEKTAHFASLKRNLDVFATRLATYVRIQLELPTTVEE